MKPRLISSFSVVGLALSVLAGCASSPPQTPAAPAARTAPVAAAGPVADQPLAGYQRELLELALASATAIPINPHIVDRSETQEKVAAACLQLDQPRQAGAYAEKIGNWRRGEVYADIALYCQQHGAADEAKTYLDRAEDIANAAGLEDWCRGLIRAKLARTYILRGQLDKVDQLQKGIDPSDQGELLQAKVMVADEKSFADQMRAVNALLATGQLDQTRVGMAIGAQLFDRLYADPDRRAAVETRIKSSWGTLPVLIRIDTLIDLYASALGHGDQTKALELLAEARAFVDGAFWPANYQIYRITLMARLAKYRCQAGDPAQARADLDAALAYFHTEAVLKQVLNTNRADVCRMFAEAYQALGQPATVTALYREAIERGVENPNSRPRAEDLSDTCRSLALHRVEPDPQMWNRLHQIYKQLGQPW